MAFVCPECGSASLEITDSLELPPDDWWDERTVQLVECGSCDFKGVASYEESRRGSLDSEAVYHRGRRLDPEPLAAITKHVRSCPNPRGSTCECAAHRALNAKDPDFGWSGPGGELFAMRWQD